MRLASTHTQPTLLQKIASDLVDGFFVERIAAALYQFDRRDPDATLGTLDPVSRRLYEREAAFVAFMRDEQKLRPALYDAANEIVLSGVGSLTRHHRAAAVGSVARMFKTLRAALVGERPAQQERLRKLAEADAQLERAPQPNVPTPQEVM